MYLRTSETYCKIVLESKETDPATAMMSCHARLLRNWNMRGQSSKTESRNELHTRVWIQAVLRQRRRARSRFFARYKTTFDFALFVKTLRTPLAFSSRELHINYDVVVQKSQKLLAPILNLNNNTDSAKPPLPSQTMTTHLKKSRVTDCPWQNQIIRKDNFRMTTTRRTTGARR